MREGGVSTIEKQALAPFGEHNEFDLNIVDALPRIIADTTYQNLSQQAYQRPLEYYVITRALAAFERSFITAGSPFDDYFYRKIPNALSSDAIAGLNLFFSDSLACSKCHSGFDFTNYSFQNNGLYNVYNALSAVSSAYYLNMNIDSIIPSLQTFECGFGRMETE